MLEGYKTYIVALAAFLIAVGGAIQAYYAGNTINYQLVIDAFIALGLLFLRKSIKQT